MKNLIDAVPSITGMSALLFAAGPTALLALPAAAAGYLLVLHVRDGLVKKREEREETEQVARFLSLLHDQISVSLRPLNAGIGGALAELDASKTKAALGSLPKRLELGQPFDESLRKVKLTSAESLDAISKVRAGDAAGGVQHALKNSYSTIMKDNKYADEIARGSLNRYLVASMVLTTILPSLVTFAFVGYTVLNYSVQYLVAYGGVLLFLLPALSTAINMKVNTLYAH